MYASGTRPCINMQRDMNIWEHIKCSDHHYPQTNLELTHTRTCTSRFTHIQADSRTHKQIHAHLQADSHNTATDVFIPLISRPTPHQLVAPITTELVAHITAELVA